MQLSEIIKGLELALTRLQDEEVYWVDLGVSGSVARVKAEKKQAISTIKHLLETHDEITRIYN